MHLPNEQYIIDQNVMINFKQLTLEQVRELAVIALAHMISRCNKQVYDGELCECDTEQDKTNLGSFSTYGACEETAWAYMEGMGKEVVTVMEQIQK